jgi:DNA-binding XRE family transcriptional regulator
VGVNVQVLAKDGQPEWAVIPFAEYKRMLEALEMLADIRAFDEAKVRIVEGEELLPSAVTYATQDGTNPVRAWRAYRGRTQQQLATMAGISKPYLSQLESGKRAGTMDVLRALAQALGLTLDDLVT